MESAVSGLQSALTGVSTVLTQLQTCRKPAAEENHIMVHPVVKWQHYVMLIATLPAEICNVVSCRKILPSAFLSGRKHY